MGEITITIDYESDWGGRVKSTYGIEKMTDKVLELLDKNNAKATFFISTETAKKTKKNILDIYNAGHEIASHGHNHHFNYAQLTKMEINSEILTSKNILEDIISDEIYGFRTPYFMKSKYTDESLLENGYKYDSSSLETKLSGRYESKQFVSNDIRQFTVSSIYNKFPAGLKWINIFGRAITSENNLKIIYLHLFDLIPLFDMCKDPNFNNINIKYKLFYLARFGSLLDTLDKLSYNSKTIKSFL